jgi:hypothetical protein
VTVYTVHLQSDVTVHVHFAGSTNIRASITASEKRASSYVDERGNRKRAEREVQHTLAKSGRVHLLRRNAGLPLVSFAPIARKVIKTAGPTSTASPVRADLASLLAHCRLGL